MWSIISQVGGYAIQLGTTMVLARILTPEDYGFVAKVAVLITVATLFSDMGFSFATIQRAKISHAQVSGLFWINVLIGIALGLLVFFVSPQIASFYDEPKLLPIARVMALSFPLNGLLLQHSALLARQMQFGKLAIIQLSSIVFSVIVGIVLALLDFGYWAIILMQLAIPLGRIPTSFILCKWRPSLPKRINGVKEMLTFGMGITGYDIVNYFSRSLDRLLIGKFDTTHNLGLYDRAYGLMMMPILQIRAPINRIGIPALAAIQNDDAKFSHTFHRIIATISITSMPLACVLYLSSDQIIYYMLGQDWMESARLFRILSIVCFLQPTISTFGIILIALGLTKQYFFWGCINSLVISVGFLFGIKYGTYGVCVSYVIGTIVMFIPTIVVCSRNTPVKPWLSFRIMAGPMFSAMSLIAMIAFIRYVIHYDTGKGFFVIFEVLTFLILYAGLMFLIKGCRELILFYYQIIVKKLCKC